MRTDLDTTEFAVTTSQPGLAVGFPLADHNRFRIVFCSGHIESMDRPRRTVEWFSW